MGNSYEPTEARPTEAEALGRIDLTNLFRKASDCGAQAAVGLLYQEEERLIGLLRPDRLPDGRPRYVRNGRYRRTLVTKLGKILFEVGRVYDRLRRRTFTPLLIALGLRRRRYTLDLRLACAEEAGRTTYGEASESIHRTLSLWVPRRTIWHFVKELNPFMEAGLRNVPLLEVEGCHAADGTFVRGLRRGSQHEVNVAVRQRSYDHKVELVAVQVDGPPTEVLDPNGVERLVTDDALAYSVDLARWHQLCHLHFLRRVRDLLTEERNLLEVAEREAVLRDLGGLLGHLRASVARHRIDGDKVAITYRVEATLRAFGETAAELEHRGLRQTARYVRERGRATVVFAEMAGHGGWMPATSNGVERIMGMVADRCKRKWAHWNSGLEDLLRLLLTRKTRPAAYSWATRRYLAGGSMLEPSLPVGPLINKS